jgi:hypothetical protein
VHNSSYEKIWKGLFYVVQEEVVIAVELTDSLVKCSGFAGYLLEG